MSLQFDKTSKENLKSRGVKCRQGEHNKTLKSVNTAFETAPGFTFQKTALRFALPFKKKKETI